MKKGIYIILCQLCLWVLLSGCQSDKSQERRDTPKTTAAPLEELTLEAQVASHTAIVVSWNALSRGTGYTLSRADNDANSSFEEIAQFKPGDTMEYTDTEISRDNKEGYLYKIAVDCEYSELDYETYDRSMLWKTMEDQTTVYTKIAEMGWLDYTTEIAYCNKVREKNQITPDEIALYLNCYATEETQPSSVEIYRGTNPQKLRMIDDVSFEEGVIQTEDGRTFIYEDQAVQYGKTYYYQVRPYAGKTQKVYAKASTVYRLAAVDAVGDYSAKLLTDKKEFTSFLRVKLSSNSAGNDKLLLHPSNMQHLIDYVYETEEGDFHSMTLQLNRYRMGKGKWKRYQGESLLLTAGKKISLEFVTKDRSDHLVYPSRHFKTAELIFRAKYNYNWQDYTIDLMNNSISGGNDPTVGQAIYDLYPRKPGHKKLTLQANVTEGQVYIGWNAIKGADEYRILRAKEIDNTTYVSYGKKKEIARVSADETTFTDTDLLEKRKGYQYVVQAYRGTGDQQVRLTKDDICIYNGLGTPKVSLYDRSYEGGSGNYIQFPYQISASPAIRPDGIEIYRGRSKDSMVRIASRKVKKSNDYWEYKEIRYTDYDVIPGQTYFYKLRGYQDTSQGRIYSEFSEPWEATAYLGYSERYRMRVLTEEKEAEKVSSFILAIHSISTGNEDISFGFPEIFDYYSSEGKKYGELKIMKYSYDGSHWKKMKSGKKVILSAQQTLYFQLESREEVPNPNRIQEDAKISCAADRQIAGDSLAYIDFLYNCRQQSVRASFSFDG